MRKIVKTTTVGSLKNKLNESKGNFALGQGFGSEPRFKSNVQDNSDYSRKLDKNGGFGLGDGFTKLNEEEMVDFIANIVESMKGKTEYHNLKFVDRIGNENGLFESQIKNIKNIIKSDRTPYQLKLRKYLTENVAEEMSEIYEGYSGLMHEGEMMVNEIKATFNEMKSMGKSTNEAVTMTAEALDVPMEMVDKMVQVQKEAYKARMEGMDETMDVNEKLCEVYESYKNMAEGNMKPVYEEIKEMMNPEEPIEESEYGEYGDWGTEEEYPKYLKRKSSEEESEEDYEARQYDAYKRDYEDEDRWNPLEEDLCMECGDDDESYIEVELSSPEDFKLLPMLAKGAMSAEKMPSMGMGKMSRAMNVPMEKDYQDYEVPMDYSVSSPYSQYKYDTGLGKIPYGKKKFSSLEGDEDSFEKPMDIYENFLTNHSINTKKVKRIISKTIFEACNITNISKCNNYVLFENRIYDIKNKNFIKKNNVLSESIIWKDISTVIINENVLTWLGNLAQNAVSIGSAISNIIVPGSGIPWEVGNGLVYFIRGYFTKNDPELQTTFYVNGTITLAFTLLGAGFGGPIAAGLKQIVSGAKLVGSTLINAFKFLFVNLGKVFGRILNFITGGLTNRIIKWLGNMFTSLRPAGVKSVTDATVPTVRKNIYDIVAGIQNRVTTFIANLLKKAGVNVAGREMAKLAGKEGFEALFKKGASGAITGVAKKKAAELLAKMGVNVGETVAIRGAKYTIKSISSKINKVTLTNSAGKTLTIGADELVSGYLTNQVFKNYTKAIFSNPSANALGARFLAGFVFGKDGSVEDINLENIPVINIDFSTVDLGAEVAGYEGETGQYTSKPFVTAVQTALEALGEDIGASGADGKYGPATKAAINKVETDLGVSLSTSITVQTIINIAVALVKANKENAAKTMINNLGADMGKNPVIEAIRKIIEDPAITDKLTAIQNAQSGASGSGAKKNWYEPSGEKKGSWIDDMIATSKGTSTVAEETFSESYKRMFGLTLD